MGNRVKGTPKKKSIKAALSSSAGSKRKLSRMGKRQKRAHAGLDATFYGRSKCLSMLQITLKDFRRLCILKGVYPREPLGGKVPGKKKGQTYYHIKDIRAIAHEPVLEKFRDFQAFMKKVRRAAGRHDKDEALRRNALLPSYTLHHLVKERYPRFQDALSDLDDALTLTYLFAALPGQGHLSAKVTNKAKSLAAAWGAYCATTSSITKSFISVKGVYLQACIHGVDIRWIVPHAFTQYLPTDVDYRVMMTFFEFYETLLNFVLFKLYSDIGVRYPLSSIQQPGEAAASGTGSTTSVLAANLGALRNALDSAKSGSAIRNAIAESVSATNDDKDSNKDNDDKKKIAAKSKTTKKEKQLIASVGAALNKLTSEDSDGDDHDAEAEDDEDVDVAGPLKAALDSMADEQAKESLPGGGNSSNSNSAAMMDMDSDAVHRKGLFRGLTFFLSREIPRGYLELVCLAHGAMVVGWQGGDDDESGTGKSPIAMNDSSITHHICDRPRLPAQYDSLPKSREYVQPQWILDCANFMFLLPIARYAIGATLPPHLSPWVDDEEEGYKPAYAEEIARIKNGESVDLSTDVMEATAGTSEQGDEDEQKPEGKEAAAISTDKDEDDDESESDDQEEEEEDEESEKAQERREKKKRKEEKEAHDLAKTMMSRKASHLYGRMQHGITEKAKKVEALQRKREEIEGKQKKGSGSGKSVLKQKVERLKKERKSVEDTYSNTTGTMKKSKKRRTNK